jgi:hypothetical protein
MGILEIIDCSTEVKRAFDLDVKEVAVLSPTPTYYYPKPRILLHRVGPWNPFFPQPAQSLFPWSAVYVILFRDIHSVRRAQRLTYSLTHTTVRQKVWSLILRGVLLLLCQVCPLMGNV